MSACDLFLPSRARALDLRQAMDKALWNSAATLLGSGETTADCSAMPAEAQDYGAYCDLTLDHPGNWPVAPADRSAAERHLRHRLGETRSLAPPAMVSPRITTLTEKFYDASELARLVRWMDIEPQNALGLSAVPDAELDATAASIASVLAHLRQSAPELHDELVVIVREILVARPDGSERLRYDGGTSFAVWGALLVNPVQHRSLAHYLKTIVHEAAHNLLFAIARDEPLVLNAPEEAYTSPLRSDPRPMDGIFHAAFVSARESLALDSLLLWGDQERGLPSDEREATLQHLENCVTGFWQCAEILRSDASLSPLGAKVLGDCEAFMTGHFALVTE